MAVPRGWQLGHLPPEFQKKKFGCLFSGLVAFLVFFKLLFGLFAPQENLSLLTSKKKFPRTPKYKLPENLPGSRSRWWWCSWWAGPPKFGCPRKWPPFGCALTSGLEDLQQHKKIIDIIFWDGTNFA